jgi:hypothetical protein
MQMSGTQFGVACMQTRELVAAYDGPQAKCRLFVELCLMHVHACIRVPLGC